MASAVGNLANTLGLHRSLDGFGLALEQAEQRRNVFWVFYLMEKAISQNLGRPSVINDDDIAVELPPKNPGVIQSPSGAKVYDLFQDQIKLAIIGSRIYNELYSANSQIKSDTARMKVLGKLDSHLQRWRDTIPLDIRPEHPIKCSDEQYVPVVMMHFKYLDFVILLHRLLGQQESFQDREVTDVKSHDQRLQLNPRVYASQLLCLAAARRSIQLLDAFSNNNLQNQHLMWTAVYYPLSASLVLFTNILSNPQDQQAASDVRLMNLITSFITHSVRPGTSFTATPTLILFKELYRIATLFVAKIPPQSSQKKKRLPESDNPVQSDFISLSRFQGLPDRGLRSDLNMQTTASIATKDSTKTHSETYLPASTSSPVHNSQQSSRGDQNMESFACANYSQASANDSPLEFAPFIPRESDQFNYIPIIHDSLVSPTSFEWDMANMWMPIFVPDP